MTELVYPSKAAGAAELQAACDKLFPVETGKAVMTPGFSLPAKYVIHAADPVYSRWHKRQIRALLRSAYLESLKLAEKNGCESIAFPLISSGIYGYPKDEALEMARLSIEEYLSERDMEVYLAMFDKSAFLIGQALLGRVESHIDVIVEYFLVNGQYSIFEINEAPFAYDQPLLGF